ncbi:MAG TPA: hypothetical protein PLZ37_06530 [Nitrospira sp.]|nr:hypothetical protein [Nitrospira sp.]
MTSQDRGNLLHAAHRRAKALGLTGEAYERELERADKPEPRRVIVVGDHQEEVYRGDAA